jgi:hypothetical protein
VRKRLFEETLSYCGFPWEHWRRVHTNNPLERILREIMRRARVVGAFDLFQTPNLGYFEPPSSNSSIYVAHPNAPTVAVDSRYHIYAGFVGCPKSLVQARAAALAL